MGKDLNRLSSIAVTQSSGSETKQLQESGQVAACMAPALLKYFVWPVVWPWLRVPT